jgi:hypothetical protein
LKTSLSFSSIADKEGELQIFLSTFVEALPQSKLAENATELNSKKVNDKKQGSEYKFFNESAIGEIFPPSKRIRLRSASKSKNFGATNKSAPSHSQDMLSISAIAAKLADDIEGSKRSVAVVLARIADGAQIIVEHALDHLEKLIAVRQTVNT